MTTLTFLLPDVGEGLAEAEIVAWRVAVGDTVVVNQVIVDIETAKSVVELPSPHAGEVVELTAAEGDTVPVGAPIIAIRTATDEPRLLVGYGAKEPGTTRRRRGATPSTGDTPVERTRPRAKPPVRKLAKTLGVDLAAVTPSGPDGVVVRADVLKAAEGDAPVRGAGTRIPIKGVRKHTAAAVVASAFTAPHVTEFVTVDVTPTLELRDVVQRRREFRGVKLTPLAFVAMAYLRALARTPMATARWDDAAQEIVVPAGVNLGIAAATPRGLVVPNIKDAHLLGLLDLATAINDLAATARAGRTTPEAMAGGTTTVTNVGVFGVDTGTPILNPGETAILAVGAIRRRPWVVEDESGERIAPRSVLQLALSFDHRVMDGQGGSELLAHTADLLSQPGLAVL
ncbi:dihydrolipoamide acetyltransferase family protein [Umezawaea endophytica]|uniref:Dihydrolipoamide acetyltransferase component of pyruvate dehydrogenase complex n=1 Tax=Umezawaea endophytica TaxID=1654476 RepID=A0A9X3A1I2_9PSEU|nr:dihydrolipoamide acetyltransferase family protein [Umezawaea endophytica]MCS7478018.1 2-oxo acid dehydrogenase subunit E2 [Umezawaea endophytica]